jgi:heme/copper-type cytochrome/quinol oxidase subunit 2
MRRRAAAALLLLGTALHSRHAPAQAVPASSDCSTDAALCLTQGRFLVEAAWRTASGASGPGHAVALTADSGYFWFFDASNIELVVKTLDACAVNDHFWFFAAGLTNVEVVITVTDASSGEVRTYTNALGTPFEPIQDTAAFADCGVVPLLVRVTQFQFSPGGPEGSPIRLQVGTTYRITFRSEDVGHGISSIPALGIDGAPILPGTDYVVTVTPTPAQRGTYNFACTHFCGVGHGSMHGIIEVE